MNASVLKDKFLLLKNKIADTFSTPQKKKIFFSKIIMFIVHTLKYILMIGLAFVIVYPLLLQLAVAFREPTDVNNPMVLWIPSKLSVQNFQIAIIALEYWQALGYTAFISLGVTLLQLFSTSIAGYAFARLKFKGSGLLFGLALFTIIVPQTMISLPMYIDFSDRGLVGQPFVLFLMAGLGMGIKSGMFIYLFRQFFKGIPVELEEAAYVDGASAFGVFFRVMLPNVRSGIITVALLAFVWQWNDYYFTNLFVVGRNVDIITLATKQQSIIYGLQQAISEAGIWQLMDKDVTSNPLFTSMILNTAGILVMIPVLIMYFFMQKLFVEGIERSGIVG